MAAYYNYFLITEGKFIEFFITGNSLSSTADMRHEYDGGPVNKRPRDSWT